MFDRRVAECFGVALASAVIASIPACASHSRVFDPASHMAKFASASELIFIDCRVNDDPRPILALIDTGANVSAVDSQLARDLQLTVTGVSQIQGTAGITEAESVLVAGVHVLGHTFRDITMTARPLAHGATPDGRPLGLIIGTDILARRGVTIDFESQTIALEIGPLRSSAATPMPIENGIPRLRAIINQTIECELRIDTGASLFQTDDLYINVTGDILEALRAANPTIKPDHTLGGTGVGGTVTLEVYRIESLQVGDRDMTAGNLFAIVQPRAGYFAQPHAVGFVGNNLLRRFGRVALDFESERMLVER